MNEFKSNSEETLVSIIMPTYNTEKFVHNSIKSVLNQTYTNWELIVVDDASNDNTVNVLNSFTNSRIKLLQNSENHGAAYCRNLGLRNANGRWIAFLDSDDLWLPTKLEKQLDFMISNNIHFSYTNYEQIDEFGQKKNRLVTGPKAIGRRDLFSYNWMGCLTVMYDAYYVGLVQIENVKQFNDYAMWLKVIKKCDCYLINETLALYRKGRCGGLSDKNYLELIKWHYRLFRDAEHLSKLSSLNYTLRNIIFGIYKKLVYEKRAISK